MRRPELNLTLTISHNRDHSCQYSLAADGRIYTSGHANSGVHAVRLASNYISAELRGYRTSTSCQFA